MEKIKVNFFIEREELTAQEYILFCKKIICSLQEMDPIYNIVETWNDNIFATFRFNADLSNFNDNNLKIIINEDKEIRYKNTDDTNKGLTINSKSWMGFSSTFSFGIEDSLQNKSVSISIKHGAYDENQTSTIIFEFSDSFQKERINKKYIVQLIKTLETQLDIKFANAISSSFFIKFRQKGYYTIGWINYVNDKTIANYLRNEDICYISKKGVLFSISDQMPTLNNEALEKTMQLRDELIKYGYLSKSI